MGSNPHQWLELWLVNYLRINVKTQRGLSRRSPGAGGTKTEGQTLNQDRTQIGHAARIVSKPNPTSSPKPDVA
jgi:hypothetical protein